MKFQAIQYTVELAINRLRFTIPVELKYPAFHWKSLSSRIYQKIYKRVSQKASSTVFNVN